LHCTQERIIANLANKTQNIIQVTKKEVRILDALQQGYSKTIEEELFNTPHSNPQTKKYFDKDFHHITHTHTQDYNKRFMVI